LDAENDAEPTPYPEDVVRLKLGDREIVLVGTAHISQESADLVREVIERERPDAVCVELDEQRYQALRQRQSWENLNLKQVIRRRQLATLLINLLLASYQKKLGGQLGVAPGTELLEATKTAEALDLPVVLCDRNIRVTLLRAWRSMSLWQKAKLVSGITAGMFEGAELSEEELRRLRRRDVLSEMMGELARYMPSLKRVLIDERDVYLSERIRQAEGRRLVAVVGAGHVEGIAAHLEQGVESDLDPIMQIPKVLPVMKWIGWGVPAMIAAALGWIAYTKGGAVAGDNLKFWILANGIPSSIGALLALAHPLTILAAFVAAPVTSLTPVIGAGYVTAFVQAYVQPPLVKDFQSVTEDAGQWRMWWSNRLLRVFLAFLLPTLGSVIGTYIGGFEIFSNLF